MRSISPAVDGAWGRPQGARAARLSSSAARRSSGLPVASAAAVSRSAVAHAMSARPDRAVVISAAVC